MRMNAPGFIDPMASQGLPGGTTSLINQGNKMAAAGPQALEGPGGTGLASAAAVLGGPVAGLAIQSFSKGMSSSADLVGRIGNNPMHQGQDINTTPGAAFQEAQDFAAGTAEDMVNSIPGLNLLGIDKMVGGLTRSLTKGKAMDRAAEIGAAQRDAERKARLDQAELTTGGQTYNDIF